MPSSTSTSVRIPDAKTIIYQSRMHRPPPVAPSGNPDLIKLLAAIDNHLNHRQVKLSTPVFSAVPSIIRHQQSPSSHEQNILPPSQVQFTHHQQQAPARTTAKRTLRFSTSSSASAYASYSRHVREEDEDDDLLELSGEYLEDEEEEETVPSRSGNGVSYAYSSPMRRFPSPTPITFHHQTATAAVSMTATSRRSPVPPATAVGLSFASRFDAAMSELPRSSQTVSPPPPQPPTLSFASRFAESAQSLASRFRAASAAAETPAVVVPPPPAGDEGNTDDDAEFARRLMEEEEAEFLERLHQEQTRALAQLRSSNAVGGEEWLDGEDEEEEDEEEEMSYERLLELGETLGDVKTERWRERSQQVMQQLVTVSYQDAPQQYKSATDMCVICQFTFEDDDMVKLMPKCTHCFHPECADAWIKDHSSCATCKAPVE